MGGVATSSRMRGDASRWKRRCSGDALSSCAQLYIADCRSSSISNQWPLLSEGSRLAPGSACIACACGDVRNRHDGAKEEQCVYRRPAIQMDKAQPIHIPCVCFQGE